MTNNTNNLINIHMIDNKGFIWNANGKKIVILCINLKITFFGIQTL